MQNLFWFPFRLFGQTIWSYLEHTANHALAVKLHRRLTACRWMNRSSRKCSGKTTWPTCVMTVAAGAGLLKPLLSLADLVPGPSGGAPVGLRHQRGNGLPQRLCLELGLRVALFLVIHRSFRHSLIWSRGLELGLIGGLVCSLGLLLLWMLAVWKELAFLHHCLTTTLWDQNQTWKHELQKKEETNQQIKG